VTGPTSITDEEAAARSASTNSESTRSRMIAAVVSVGLLVALGGAAAVAGSCRVLLALGSVQFEPSPAGLSVRIGGNWEFDNLVQVTSGLSFNVLFIRGDKFVRLQYPDAGYTGTVPGLEDALDAGLTGNDLLNIEAAGVSHPRARFVSLEAQRMKLSVPILKEVGPANILAYIVLDGDYMLPIISNTITKSIKGLETGTSTGGPATAAEDDAKGDSR
jgi:hypothetical protein